MGWELLAAGVAVGVAGGFSTSLAYFVMKRLHNRLLAEAGSKCDVEGKGKGVVPDKLQTPAGYKFAEWWLGVLLLVIGAVSGIVNLGLLGQLAIAPFASFTLIFNALLGALLLQESYTTAIFCSSVVVVTGVILSATQIHADREDYSKEDLKELFSRDWIPPLLACILAFIFVSSAAVFCCSAEGQRIVSNGQDSKSDITRDDQVSKAPLLADGNAEHKSKAFDFSRTGAGLLFYAATCGLCSGLNSTILKVLVELLKNGKGKTGGLENLGRWEFWTILFCCLMPLITLQLWTLDQGLKRHQSVLVVPPMTGAIIFFNAVAGHTFFDEGSYYKRQEIEIFYGGLVLTVIGTLSILSPNLYQYCIPEATATDRSASKKTG